MGTWIDNLKVGSTVLVQRGWNTLSMGSAEVVRETPTQLVLKIGVRSGVRIAKKTGREIGALNRHDQYRLMAETAENFQLLERAKLNRWAQQAQFLLPKLPVVKLRQIKLLYDKLAKE